MLPERAVMFLHRSAEQHENAVMLPQMVVEEHRRGAK